jgi:hypothetical protein
MIAYSAVLIIRFHYADNDPRFYWRFKYFRNEVLPRILAQTNQNFDIAIRCNPEHDKLFQELNPRIKTFHIRNERVSYFKSKNGKRYFRDHARWDEVEGLPMYDIQMGLDSDDLITPDYVQIMRETCRKFAGIAGNTDKKLHLSFQPRKIYLKTGREIGMMEYTPTRGSAFMALFQPIKDATYKFIYCMSHLNLCKIADDSITIPSGHCLVSIHGHNESTR